MPDKLVINNNSSGDITIQGQLIPANSTYTIPDENITLWATDAYLRFLVINNIVDIIVFGVEWAGGSGSIADTWLSRVASGSLVYY